MHEAYHIEGKTDLAVIRSQAQERTKPNNRYGRQASATVVHHHASNEPCSPAGKHDFFPVSSTALMATAYMEESYWANKGYTIRDLYNIQEANESA